MSGDTSASLAVPDSVQRLFDGYEASILGTAEQRDFLIGRLLEDGDRRDLAWLSAEVGAAALADWIRRRGERQLSRRSRLFWQKVFRMDTETEPQADRRALREELWPL